MRPVDLFHLGPPKSGTTWIYRCLAEHPSIITSPRDSIHYFDMFYSRGESWYAGHFSGHGNSSGDTPDDDAVLFDPTPAYLRSTWAPRRIAKHNPRAKLAVCLRNPIERAFSHYWHGKKKRKYSYEFGDILRNYDLFQSWLEPGLYAEHLERYLDCFPREQILVQRFDDMKSDAAGFLGELLRFAGVDDSFVPSVRDRKINVAGPRHDAFHMSLYAVQRGLDVIGFDGLATRFRGSERLSGKGEYLRGIPAEVGDALIEICEPEIRRLEDLLDVDLDCWRRTTPAKAA